MELAGNLVGGTGVICFLTAYFLLQKEKIKFTDLNYLGLNLAGSIMVIFSLLVRWNLSAFLLEAMWGSITLYGIYKHVYLPRRGVKDNR